MCQSCDQPTYLVFDDILHVEVNEAVHPSPLVGLEWVAAVNEVQDKGHSTKAPVL